ncbi:MAG: hypothetical protein JW946_03225 [Candidatus Omnitrophica bacterium]|nr:hypothetical protein [Candidatus Omnitrophota bacterium]
MNKYIIIISAFFSAVWLLTMDVNAAEKSPKDMPGFRYNAMDVRDPFMPLVTKDGKIAYGYSAIKNIGDLRLEGIVFDPSAGSIAIINGALLRKNETIGNIKLLDVEQNRVKILFNQKEYFINLKNED